MNIIKTLTSSISEKGNYCYSLPVETTKEIIKDVKQLKQENQELKKQIETLEKANKQLIYKLDRYDAIVDERDELKKQLDYLRSGEYYNQLRFERDMLQNVVDNGEVSKEDKEFIDMTHRNTELLEQQKEFIEYLESEINKIKEQIKNYDIWHEVGTDINFLILKKQFNIEILSKYKEIIGVSK